MPPRQLQLGRTASGSLTVLDPRRGRHVALTPEEWVRQHFVAHLVHDLGYPGALVANEVSVKLNGLSRRCDTVVWRRGTTEPLMIVEYKAPTVTVSQRTFDQIVRYNMVLRARWLVVSNGLEHYVCEVDCLAGTYRFVNHIPPYPELL